MIRVDNLTKTYERANRPAVDGVSLTVDRGQFFTLLGPSGCGKTTTLRCIAGLETPDHGLIALGNQVVADGRASIPTHKRNIGMVFQSYAVWPHMNVFDNVAFPLVVAGARRSATSTKERVGRALGLVGLDGLESRMATQLSGGQQQRLSLARAIVREPEVLLLDEPLSNLDAKLRERMRSDLSLLQRRLGITTLFVTHDQVEALSMSDRIAVMRDGHVMQEGSPWEIYSNPSDEFVATFIGSTNLLAGTVTENANGVCAVETRVGSLRVDASDPSIPAGSAVVVIVRPEEVVVLEEQDTLESRPNVFKAEVVLGLFGGAFTDYELDVDGHHLRARLVSGLELKPNTFIRIQIPPGACRMFRKEQVADEDHRQNASKPTGQMDA